MFRASAAHLQEVNDVNCTCMQPLVFSFFDTLLHLVGFFFMNLNKNIAKNKYNRNVCPVLEQELNKFVTPQTIRGISVQLQLLSKIQYNRPKP